MSKLGTQIDGVIDAGLPIVQKSVGSDVLSKVRISARASFFALKLIRNFFNATHTKIYLKNSPLCRCERNPHVLTHPTKLQYFTDNGQPIAAKLIATRTAASFQVHCLGKSMRLRHFNLCADTTQLSGLKGEYVLAAVGKDGFFTLSASKDVKPQPMLLSSIRDIRQWGETVSHSRHADVHLFI